MSKSKEFIFANALDKTIENYVKKHDLVTVVRCKECKRYRYDDVFHRWYCSIGMTKRATSKDDYCSWGERREDAEIHKR